MRRFGSGLPARCSTFGQWRDQWMRGRNAGAAPLTRSGASAHGARGALSSPWPHRGPAASVRRPAHSNGSDCGGAICGCIGGEMTRRVPAKRAVASMPPRRSDACGEVVSPWGHAGHSTPTSSASGAGRAPDARRRGRGAAGQRMEATLAARISAIRNIARPARALRAAAISRGCRRTCRTQCDGLRGARR